MSEGVVLSPVLRQVLFGKKATAGRPSSKPNTWSLMQPDDFSPLALAEALDKKYREKVEGKPAVRVMRFVI